VISVSLESLWSAVGDVLFPVVKPLPVPVVVRVDLDMSPIVLCLFWVNLLAFIVLLISTFCSWYSHHGIVGIPPFNEDCPICLNDQHPPYWIRLQCGHRFHLACISQWIFANVLSPTCPICRGRILLERMMGRILAKRMKIQFVLLMLLLLVYTCEVYWIRRYLEDELIEEHLYVSFKLWSFVQTF
jgi:hypothetical protein